MILIKLVLHELLSETASRQNGAVLRNKILESLQKGEQVEIDCANINLTPSFADEAFGLLCNHMTHQMFLDRIKFVNLSLAHKSLLIRVLGNRFSKQNT